jgi:hypothetical protein
MNNKTRPDSGHEFQKGCPDIIPNLRANPFWEKEMFPFINVFLENIEVIKKELNNLRNEKGF